MKHQFGWDLPPGVSAKDIEDAQEDGEQELTQTRESQELARIHYELNDAGVPEQVWIGTDSTADRVTWLIVRNKLNQQNSRSRLKAMNSLADIVEKLELDGHLRKEAETALVLAGRRNMSESS